MHIIITSVQHKGFTTERPTDDVSSKLVVQDPYNFYFLFNLIIIPMKEPQNRLRNQ